MPPFGTLLKSFRMRAALTQEQLAERAGVSSAAIGALEQGLRRAPYRQTVELLAKALALTPPERVELVGAADAARHRTTNSAAIAVDLPQATTTFIERPEIAELVQQLRRQRLTTITGTGGVGKTRTALEAARIVAAGGLECAFADLSARSAETSIWAAIAAARKLSPVSDEHMPAAVMESVAARPFLLVLDNCEHVIEQVADVVHALLAGCPLLTLLLTSRERLGMMTEYVYRLPSMAMPLGTIATLEEAAGYTALQLLIERAQNFDARAPQAIRDIDSLVDICRMLDGIPLAIELAAFHLSSLGAAGVRSRLQDGLPLPGPRDLPKRHQTMAAAIVWSFDLLDPAERSLIERLGVFSGGFALEAVQAVCSEDGLPSNDMLTLLTRLIQKSLVNVSHTATSTRYELLETVRAFAAGCLIERGIFAQMRGRHAAWLANVAHDFQTSRPRKSPATLYPELENVRSALAWGLESDDEADIAAAGTIAGRLRLVWFSLERNAELETWATRLLPRLSEPEHDTIVSHLCVALVNCCDRDPNLVLHYGERAARLLLKNGEDELAASVSAQIAAGLSTCGRFAEAELALKPCDGWLANPDARGTYSQLNTLLNRAGVYRLLGRFAESRADLQAILEAIDAQNDPDNHFRIYARLASAATEFSDGRAELAKQLCTEVIDEFRPADGEPVFWLAVARCNLSSYLLALDQVDQARPCAMLSLRDLQRLDMGCEELFLYLATIFALQNELSKAAKLLGFVDAWIERTGYALCRTDVPFRTIVLDALATLPGESANGLMQSGRHQTFAQISALAAA
jgi:predicted ATPase/DNA-binding XRE family transcriptional regulator